MCSDEPAISKFKRVSTDLPNLEILTKSATHGEIQATYMHASVGNKSFGKKSHPLRPGGIDGIYLFSITTNQQPG